MIQTQTHIPHKKLHTHIVFLKHSLICLSLRMNREYMSRRLQKKNVDGKIVFFFMILFKMNLLKLSQLNLMSCLKCDIEKFIHVCRGNYKNNCTNVCVWWKKKKPTLHCKQTKLKITRIFFFLLNENNDDEFWLYIKSLLTDFD